MKRNYRNFIIFLILLLGCVSNANNAITSSLNNTNFEDTDKLPVSSDVFDQGILYSGDQDSIEINESAIYTKISQYTIGNGTNPEYTSQNESFPVDEDNNWQGYRYSAIISKISDENDWISNGNFGSDEEITPSSHNVQIFESSHPYANFLESDPNVLQNVIATIDGTGCDYMRLHFENISTEAVVDRIYLWDQNNDSLDWYSGNYDDLMTPWFNASGVKITMGTSAANNYYGFYINYFETYDGLLFSINSDGWTPYGIGLDLSRMNAIAGQQMNNSAINITLEGIPGTGNTFNYYRLDESGIYQELSIPRGKVVDAWFSMDYNVLRGINNDEMILFFKINGEYIYKQGFHTITTEGLTKWHNTGLIHASSWLNGSTLFNGNLIDQILNISVGVQATKIRTYSGEHSDLQEAYFDNIKLFLKTEVNSTQTGINLKIDNFSLIDSISQWGKATFNRFHTWDTNPIQITLSTDSLKIEFTIESELYALHIGLSKLEEYGSLGSQVIIYTNNSVHWNTYYRTFIPLYYENYTFTGIKPQDWEILQVFDPLGNSTYFNNGERGSNTFTVEYPDSNLPGWWSFKATSTNMIQSASTELWNGSGWDNYLIPLFLEVEEVVRIKTALNTSVGNIENNASTWANLTIYSPNDIIWHTESVHPDIFGNIQFSDIEIGAFNTTGGLYQYSIVWINGTSAGGLNGTFNIRRNIEATMLYPRDAINDYSTEEIFGDVIPLRIKFNDSITGEILSNLNVQYNWTSGTETLYEISNGIYDGTLDSLDLITPGHHYINFTAWGNWYHNLSFTLQINLVEETELKIVGLDNNIDYGTNFSIRVSYTSKHLTYGITDANIALNLSSTHYYVSPEIEEGRYLINISSKDAFTGAGQYDIQINASKLYFQDQDIVTRIHILPRSVYFQIYINSADCSFNRSYSSFIKQNLNFSVGIFSSSEDLPVLSGNVYLTDGVFTSEPFSLIEESYNLELNSSEFGLGVHFVSLVFNETTYQSASEIIMLSVTRLNLNATLFNTDQTLVKNRKEGFEVLIYVKDPLASLPIMDVNISYSWIFGRGFLTYMGEGIYKFEEKSPNQVGTYTITFTITSPNADYESSIITVILVSQPLGGLKDLWWIFIPIGAVLTITIAILSAITYKQKVLIPKREKEVELLKRKTQVFDDITNIKSILIIETNTGRLMYRHIMGGLNEDNEDIFSGFLHAILTLSNKFALRNGELGDKQEYAEFIHDIFHVLVVAGHKIIVALILEEKSSKELQKRAFNFIDEFEGIYASILEKWDGDRSVFNGTTPRLFEEIFNLSLLRRYKLNDTENFYLIEKSQVRPGTLSEKIAQIIKTISEERQDFQLRTLISLIPKKEQLEAKNIVLRLIKNKYLIPSEKTNP